MTSKNVQGITEKQAQRRNRQSGFTLMEVLVVASITVVVAGAAVMKLDTAVKSVKLRSSVGEIAGLCQMARIHAVKDNKFYQIILPSSTASQQTAFVDVDGNGTASPTEPLIQLESSNFIYGGAVNPPSPPALTTMSLDSTFTPQPQTSGSATNPWFNNRGLPCVPNSTSSPTLCTTNVGTVGYVIYVQDSFNNWGAVVITPAGRIRGWTWNGSAWN